MSTGFLFRNYRRLKIIFLAPKWAKRARSRTDCSCFHHSEKVFGFIYTSNTKFFSHPNLRLDQHFVRSRHRGCNRSSSYWLGKYDDNYNTLLCNDRSKHSTWDVCFKGSRKTKSVWLRPLSSSRHLNHNFDFHPCFCRVVLNCSNSWSYGHRLTDILKSLRIRHYPTPWSITKLIFRFYRSFPDCYGTHFRNLYYLTTCSSNPYWFLLSFCNKNGNGRCWSSLGSQYNSYLHYFIFVNICKLSQTDKGCLVLSKKANFL